MKYLKYLAILSLAMGGVSVAQAFMSPRQVSIPFSNEPILTPGHTGLIFNYDMNGNPARKIVCRLAHVYKGRLEFPDQGSIEESGVYGGTETITLTSKGITSDPQFHADSSGSVTVNDTKTRHPAITRPIATPDKIYNYSLSM
jgi:hypothetical protein